MQTACPHCQNINEVEPTPTGTEVPCSNCGQPLVIPQPDRPAIPVLPPMPAAAALPPTVAVPAAAGGLSPVHRWLLYALILLSVAVWSYARLHLGPLGPILRKEFGISNEQYGWLASSFFYASIVGSLGLGLMSCLLGARWTYGILLVGTCMAMLTSGLASSLQGLMIGRILLGLAVSGGVLLAVQAVSECAPRKAQAIFLAPILALSAGATAWAPQAITLVASSQGWRVVCYITAWAAFFWLLVWGALTVWALLARRQPGPVETLAAGFRSLGRLRSWLFVVARLLMDPLVWFLSSWSFFYLQNLLDLPHGNPDAVAWQQRLSLIMGLSAIAGMVLGALASDIPALLGLRLSTTRASVLGAGGVLMALAAAALCFATTPVQFVIFAAITTAAYQAVSVNLYASLAAGISSRGVGLVVGLGTALALIPTALLGPMVGRLMDHGTFRYAFLGFGVLALLGTVPAFFVAWSLRSGERSAAAQ